MVRHANLAARYCAMGSTCIISVFKPTSLKQNPVKTIIHGNNTCLFQSLVDCARQFLWPSVGRKKECFTHKGCNELHHCGSGLNGPPTGSVLG